MWVHNDKLQIMFKFRSGPMIFGWVMALGLWNLANYLVVTTFFAMLRDIDLIFGIWVYNDKLQIKFAFRSCPMNFGRVMTLGLWNLAKYLVVTTYFGYTWWNLLDFLEISMLIAIPLHLFMKNEFSISTQMTYNNVWPTSPRSTDQHWTLFSLEDICHQ
jgi:hypothetical protein